MVDVPLTHQFSCCLKPKVDIERVTVLKLNYIIKLILTQTMVFYFPKPKCFVA